MSSVKSTGSGNSATIESQPATTSTTKPSEKSITERGSSSPTAQETKSSQQLALAKKEELGLSTISKTLNSVLDSVKKFGESASKESNTLAVPQQSAQIIFAGFPKSSSVTPSFKATLSPEEMFSICEKGHEQPNKIVRLISDADKIVQKDYQDLLNATPNSKLPSTITPDSDQTSIVNSEGHEVSRWLDDNLLGTTVHERFKKTPPFFTTVPPDYFDAKGIDANSEYTPGTNHISISSNITNEADRKRLLAHEQLHYASHLGGGDSTNMRWRAENGEAKFNGSKPSALWLHEGLTELHAQQLTKDMGFKTTEASYPQELRVAFLMQKVVDNDAMVRDAFLTGNFTEVRKRIDEKLPSASPVGTFDQIMEAKTPNEALIILTNSTTEAGIDHTPWLSDPLLSLARPKHTIIK